MRAITESGAAVLLNQDGTWAPADLVISQSQEGFRKAPWGASPSAVKASEGGDPGLEQDDYLDFEVRLGRFRCLATYIFVAGQLVRGKYLVLEEYQNLNNHLHDYDELKASVAKKYGTPTKDDTYWSNDLYEDDYAEWGMAVSCWHLSRFAHWGSAESEINLAVYGQNFKVTVSVEYASKTLAELESTAREAELLGDL
jgi:hypothetical protein